MFGPRQNCNNLGFGSSDLAFSLVLSNRILILCSRPEPGSMLAILSSSRRCYIAESMDSTAQHPPASSTLAFADAVQPWPSFHFDKAP
jgi:hypothetical protein